MAVGLSSEHPLKVTTRASGSSDAAGARALASVRARLAAPIVIPDEPAIRLTARDWMSALEDSEIRDRVDEFVQACERVLALDHRDHAVLGGALRRAADRAVDAFLALELAAESVAWFDSGAGHGRRRDALGTLLASARTGLDDILATVTREDDHNAVAWSARRAEMHAALSSLEVDVTDAEDETSVLGTIGRFRDSRGLIDPSRVEAAFSDRRDELAQLTARATRALTTGSQPTVVPKLNFVLPLLLNDRPLLCHEVARGTMALVQATWAIDPQRVVGVIERGVQRAVYGAYSHFEGLAPAVARYNAGTGAERARGAMDAVRIASEGPLRQTAWKILQLRSGASGDAPMLSEIRNLLLADGSRLSLLLARGIKAALRNAGAHEGHYWDAGRERIVIGDDAVTVEEVIDATNYAVAVMEGFETGVIFARARIPELNSRFENRPEDRSAPFADLNLRGQFGRHGALVWQTDWSADGHEVTVVIDELTRASQVFPTLVGAYAAHEDLPRVRTFRITSRDRSRSFELNEDALTAGAALMPPDPAGRKVDPGVFLPLVAAMLRSQELTAQEVGDQVSRLALHGPLVIAQEEAAALQRADPATAMRLASSFGIAGRAAQAAWTLAGSGGAHREECLRLLRIGSDASTVLATARPRSLRRFADAMNAALDLYHRIPARPGTPGSDDEQSAGADAPTA